MRLELAPVCNARGKALAHLFIAHQKQRSNDTAITDDLLGAIYHEALPPTVFGTWLLVFRSDDALVKALQQSRSCVVRKSAIQQLRSRMRKGSWKATWDELGGIEGMISLFAQFSVEDVKGAASAIGHCSKGERSSGHEACVEALLRCLAPSIYRNAGPKSTDRRPLLQYYALLVPVCNIKQGIDLLSGINVFFNGATSEVDSWRVAEANEILKELFNTACSALYEPSFHVSDWTATNEIFSRVIERRLEVTETHKARFDISDDSIYRNVWENTIITLIDVERSACMPEQARLDYHSALGPLSGFRPPLTFTAEPRFSESSYRFFDKLAKARDELWRTVRPSQHPSAASLRRPWPKGLPIQCLTGSLPIAAAPAGGWTPYLSSLATRLVLLDMDAALSEIPSDDEKESSSMTLCGKLQRCLENICYATAQKLQRATGGFSDLGACDGFLDSRRAYD